MISPLTDKKTKNLLTSENGEITCTICSLKEASRSPVQTSGECKLERTSFVPLSVDDGYDSKRTGTFDS